MKRRNTNLISIIGVLIFLAPLFGLTSFANAQETSQTTQNSLIYGGPTVFSQAMDNGFSSFFYHNHWDNHTTPDGDGDGIVDASYGIAGTAGTTDSIPRVLPYYLANNPLIIDDSQDFIDLGLPGTGTQADPYKLEGYKLIGESGGAVK